MTEKQRQENMCFAPEVKPSMLRRSEEHDYQNERRKVTSLQCQTMNLLATEICRRAPFPCRLRCRRNEKNPLSL